MYRLMILGKNLIIFLSNMSKITMIYYVTYLSKFLKKRKLREIIDFGLWLFRGRHSVLGYPTIFFCESSVFILSWIKHFED